MASLLASNQAFGYFYDTAYYKVKATLNLSSTNTRLWLKQYAHVNYCSRGMFLLLEQSHFEEALPALKKLAGPDGLTLIHYIEKRKEMRKASKMKAAYRHQKADAKTRRVEFTFTYHEWVEWWKGNLGENWFELRGKGYGRYVMARMEDRGPYSPQNTQCLTPEQNISMSSAKLTPADVAVIYLRVKNGERGIMAKVAREFEVNRCTILKIRDKASWVHITDLLDQIMPLWK
jgi:hypothetical protein